MTNYSLELCPIVNKGAIIHKSLDSLPSVKGYEIPLQPTTCDLVPVDGWKVPLEPIAGGAFGLVDLNWSQEKYSTFTAIGSVVKPTNYWIFSCSPPQGLFEGSCPKCFPQSAAVFLVGNLGFSAGGQLVREGRVSWKVHRDDLPFPGESLVVLALVSGDGDAYIAKERCAAPSCGAHGSDCMWSRTISMFTSGRFLVIASSYFATPTWTGGKLLDYYTVESGWAGLSGDARVFPVCDVYGNETLKYKVLVEEVIREVTSVGFAGYGIGTHVLLKKLGTKYSEPFSDSCLGVADDVPAESVGEELGVSDGTFSPPLLSLSRVPIDVNKLINVNTAFDYYAQNAWHRKSMDVTVNPDGSCSGDCSAGHLILETGVWAINIVWNNIPNAEKENWTKNREGDIVRKADQKVMTIVCNYTKAKETCSGIVIIPWHVMGMGG